VLVRNRLGLTRKQLVHSVETTDKSSHHEKVLRKKIEEAILQASVTEDNEIDEEELKRLVFLEEASRKVRTLFPRF